jgi:hypothetical protein
MKKSTLIFPLTFSTALILSFQNCSKTGFQPNEGSLASGGASGLVTSSLEIDSKLADSGEENGAGAMVALVASDQSRPDLVIRREIPRFIQFVELENSIEDQVERWGSRCFPQEDGKTICWGVVNSSEKSDLRNDPPVSRRRLDEKYAFHLDVRKGFIASLESREVLYKLNEAELKSLREIFRNSILTDYQKPLAINAANRFCLMVYKSGYANLITNRNVYDLGSSKDSCSLLDLFKKPNFENAGLENFLKKLAEKFAWKLESMGTSPEECPDNAICDLPN